VNQSHYGKLKRVAERDDPGRIAGDLADCRQRGLDWLDRSTSNQAPVRATALQQLAQEYIAARHLAATGRIAQIKVLLRDGIDELTRQGHTTDADLLRDLFFGESTDGPIKSPGELLRSARERVGDSSEARFRERRANVMRSFAHFLVDFAASAPREPDRGQRVSVPEQHSQPAVTGHVGDSEHFIQLLTSAVNVTIVGITNEHLKPILEEALRRKRAAEGPDAFWESIRIVFLGKALLDAVNDEREEFHDSREALRQRRQEAVWARTSIGIFLTLAYPTRWTLYQCPYLPVLTGSLLEFSEGKKIAHLLIRRPRRSTADHLYIDLDDVANRFSAVFEDIVRNSESANMIVPVGVPAEGAFQCTGVRLQRNALKDRSGADGWLPMVLVVTLRRRSGHVEAVLQLRSQENRIRELNRLSHLAGHILQDDRVRPEDRPLMGVPKSFGLTDDVPLVAARRVVEEVTGDNLASAIRPVGTGKYLYPDKEYLYFFIFALDLPEGTQFPRRAEMHSFPLSELLAVRANQVLRCAVKLCQATDVSHRTWYAAAEVVALNLSLHDYADLGETVLGLAGRRREELTHMAAMIEQMVTERTAPSWASAGREVPVIGLAGWQYREFFSVLLPLYADNGVAGASELLDLVNLDQRKRAALPQLAELYQDEHLMASMPIEL
jgi:hypothetical protein